MFTGIITDIGRVKSVEARGDTRYRITTAFDTASIERGASIACDGVCLTVVETGPDWFAVDASAETLACTTLGAWVPDKPVNLERALKVGDELGGHIVSGHVDGVARVVDRRAEGDSVRFTLAAPVELMKFIASKGSVALNGASITVNEVDAEQFGINIIPHTQEKTTFGTLAAGDAVNVEIDVLARYVARLKEMDA